MPMPAYAVVGERLSAGEVGADVIALDHVVARANDGDAVIECCRKSDCPPRGAADVISPPSYKMPTPMLAIANGIRAGGVGADEIAEDIIVARARIRNINAIRWLPEITLRAPALVPPTVLPLAPPIR